MKPQDAVAVFKQIAENVSATPAVHEQIQVAIRALEHFVIQNTPKPEEPSNIVATEETTEDE